jgi:hypothetical protein
MLLRAGVSPLLRQKTARQVFESGAVPQSRGSADTELSRGWGSQHICSGHVRWDTPRRSAVRVEEWSLDGRLQNTVIPSRGATPWLSLCLRFPQCLSRIMV